MPAARILAVSEKARLPDIWVHRTPTRSYYGPLEAARDPGHRGEGHLGLLRRLLRSALHGPEGGPGAGWLHVLHVLARTDFRARYRSQALGLIWSLLNPLVMMAIMSLIFTQVFRTTNQHFPIFLLIGLLFWQWVSASINSATQVFVSHADVIKRTVFPRHMLPVAMVLSYGVNCCIESLLLLVFVPIFPGAFRLSPALLLLPVLLGLLAVLLSGIALAASVLNVIYRDVAYIVNTGLLLLYWLTPVIYPLEVIPLPYRTALLANPFCGLLLAVRRVIMEGLPPTPLMWASVLLPTVVILALGLLVFRHFERQVLDYV
jgi:ABC-type polysaccharide/polyol phosphate export permease